MKIFNSRSPILTIKSIFLSYYLTDKHEICILRLNFQKKDYIKELCKKQFENILN